jgi:hypothetical protein
VISSYLVGNGGSQVPQGENRTGEAESAIGGAPDRPYNRVWKRGRQSRVVKLHREQSFLSKEARYSPADGEQFTKNKTIDSEIKSHKEIH